MEEYITGYQYGDDGSYIGRYTFPNNKDKDDIHLPPRTVLAPPPLLQVTDGKESAWDGEKWIIRDEGMTWTGGSWLEDPRQAPASVIVNQ